MKHSWDKGDMCVRCGTKRRKQPLAQSVPRNGGKFDTYEYFSSNKWTYERPECK